MAMQQTRVLVTGCSGNIGSQIVGILLPMGYEIIGLDEETPQIGWLDNKNFSFIRGDIRNLSLFSMIKEVDYVFHCAGLFDEEKVKADPIGSHYINVIGTVNVLEYCRRIKARLVIQSDSDFTDNLLNLQKSYQSSVVIQYGKDYDVDFMEVVTDGNEDIPAQMVEEGLYDPVQS